LPHWGRAGVGAVPDSRVPAEPLTLALSPEVRGNNTTRACLHSLPHWGRAGVGAVPRSRLPAAPLTLALSPKGRGNKT
ncbi:MAG: hypothetical protein JWQ88_2674, partial [Rhodoferax sp.]|nr:hypothetical protein [Rhodoferax sp.]